MLKKKILFWGDAPNVGTGFGVVAKNILNALYKTNKYEIDQIAINSAPEFADKSLVPWQLLPAILLDPNDVHGYKILLLNLQKKQYDYLFILNDLHVTHYASEKIKQVISALKTRGLKVPKIVYYYPVDLHVKLDHSSMLKLADVPVCYTDHGKEETLSVLPELEKKLKQIPHGVDTKAFYPLSYDIRKKARKEMFGIEDDTTLVVSVNRNSVRKQIAYSILAFKEFKKKVPNSKMYIHTAVKDRYGPNLLEIAKSLNLKQGEDLIFPMKYSPATPAPESVMNAIYNAGDLFLSTHLGEGWGITVTEALAVGLPVVVPNNTCMPEQLGEKSERGFMYECKDYICVDDGGFRPKGLISDIVNKMTAALEEGKFESYERVKNCEEWIAQHDWKKVCQKWVSLFDKLDSESNLKIVRIESIGETI